LFEEKESSPTTKKEVETKEENNCHLVPKENFQSNPCHRQEVTHNVGQTERYEGFPEGNLRRQDIRSPRRPVPPYLFLRVQ